MINVEEEEVIISKIKECVLNNPGPFPGEPVSASIEKNQTKEKSKSEKTDKSSLNFADIDFNIDSNFVEEIVNLRLKLIDLELKNIGNLQKYKAGYKSGKIVGFVLGFIATIFTLILLFLSISIIPVM